MCKQCLILGSLILAGGRSIRIKSLARHDHREKSLRVKICNHINSSKRQIALAKEIIGLDTAGLSDDKLLRIEGYPIETNYGLEGTWHEGKIIAMNADGTFNVLCSHGRSEFSVPESCIATSETDTKAVSHLSQTLESFKQEGIDLVPMQVDSDGSCLPHSISRALVGAEIFFDVIRADIVTELVQYEGWYREHCRECQIYDDEGYKTYWDTVIKSAEPTKGKRVGREKYLEHIHIQALANAMMRPILLLDSPDGMADMGGMFLPLRHSRADILENNHGQSPSPVIIGWQTDNNDHYIALVRKECTKADINQEFISWIDEVSARSTHAGARNTAAAVSDVMTFVTQLLALESMDQSLYTTIYCFFIDNKPWYRTESATRLVTILRNILGCLKGTKDPRRFGEIKLDNPAIRTHIAGVSFAKEILLSAGFRESSIVDAARGVEVDGLKFDFDAFPPGQSRMMQQTKVEIVIEAIDKMVTSAALKDKAFSGRHQVCTVEAEKKLFGQRPKALRVEDVEAIKQRLRAGPEEPPAGCSPAAAEAYHSDRVAWESLVEEVVGRRDEAADPAEWRERLERIMADGPPAEDADLKQLHDAWLAVAKEMIGPRPGYRAARRKWHSQAVEVVGEEEPCCKSPQRLKWEEARNALEWDCARRLYGEGSAAAGAFWSASSGSSGDEILTQLTQVATKTFKAVTKQSWSSAMRILMGLDGALLTCPICNTLNEVPVMDLDSFSMLRENPDLVPLLRCVVCSSYLSINQTLAAVVERLVQDALRDATSVWICQPGICDTANLASQRHCDSCGTVREATTAAEAAEAARPELLGAVKWACSSRRQSTFLGYPVECGEFNPLTETQCRQCGASRDLTSPLTRHKITIPATSPRGLPLAATATTTAAGSASATSSMCIIEQVARDPGTTPGSERPPAATTGSTSAAAAATAAWACHHCTYSNETFETDCVMCGESRGSTPWHQPQPQAEPVPEQNQSVEAPSQPLPEAQAPPPNQDSAIGEVIAGPAQSAAPAGAHPGPVPVLGRVEEGFPDSESVATQASDSAAVEASAPSVAAHNSNSNSSFRPLRRRIYAVAIPPDQLHLYGPSIPLQPFTGISPPNGRNPISRNTPTHSAGSLGSALDSTNRTSSMSSVTEGDLGSALDLLPPPVGILNRSYSGNFAGEQQDLLLLPPAPTPLRHQLSSPTTAQEIERAKEELSGDAVQLERDWHRDWIRRQKALASALEGFAQAH